MNIFNSTVRVVEQIKLSTQNVRRCKQVKQLCLAKTEYRRNGVAPRKGMDQ